MRLIFESVDGVKQIVLPNVGLTQSVEDLRRTENLSEGKLCLPD